MIEIAPDLYTRRADITRMRDWTKSRIVKNKTDQLGKTMANTEEGKANTSTLHDQPRARSRINDNYCVAKLQVRLLARSPLPTETIDNCLSLNVKPLVVSSVHTVPGHSQKRELSPGSAGCHYKECTLKYVKSVSCVTQLSCVKLVTNVKNVVSNLPVGARLQNYWQTWLDLGAGPKVVQILKEGYTLPFQIWPKLTRSPTVISCYVNLPDGGIASAYTQKCSGISTKQNISELFQPSILCPKAKQQMETYIGSKQSESFPQGGEIQNGDTRNHQDIPPTRGVGHLNRFQGRLLHIPIQEQSRKYLRLHVQGQTYQFKALPFGLSTAPLEFTVVAKEVKLMAIHKGIRIHQYLDDCLVRATSHRVCLQHTQDLVKICQGLGWLVNSEKSELEPKQIFDFVGYQFDLKAGLLTATDKQVHLGRLHMRPIQWHLKKNWRVPESLEKVIPIPRSLHPHLQWWLQEDKVLTGQPLHSIKHAVQIFTDT